MAPIDTKLTQQTHLLFRLADLCISAVVVVAILWGSDTHMSWAYSALGSATCVVVVGKNLLDQQAVRRFLGQCNMYRTGLTGRVELGFFLLQCTLCILAACKHSYCIGATGLADWSYVHFKCVKLHPPLQQILSVIRSFGRHVKVVVQSLQEHPDIACAVNLIDTTMSSTCWLLSGGCVSKRWNHEGEACLRGYACILWVKRPKRQEDCVLWFPCFAVFSAVLRHTVHHPHCSVCLHVWMLGSYSWPIAPGI